MTDPELDKIVCDTIEAIRSGGGDVALMDALTRLHSHGVKQGLERALPAFARQKIIDVCRDLDVLRRLLEEEGRP